MLRAEDLAVGDWVKTVSSKKESYQRVKVIYSSMVAPYIITTGTEEKWFLSEIEPIPLTPEILKKNGFSGEGYNMGIIGFHTDPIPEVKDGYEVFIWKDMCLEIKHGFTHLKRYTFYVHELQHALKLCGINLEIKV